MNPDLLQRIELYRNEFTKTDTELSDYLVSHLHDFATMNIDAIASKSGFSRSSFVRFAQKIGFSGYAEFRFEVSRYLVSRNTEEKKIASNPIESISQTYSDYILSISQTVSYDQVKHIAQMIQNAVRIKILGINRSFQAARQLKQRLGKIGYDSEATPDSVDMLDSSCICDENDLFIIFTISGKGGYEEIIHNLCERHIPFVVITMSQILPYRRQCAEYVTLPRIDKDTSISFLDNQAIFFVMIEIILHVLASEAKQ